MISHFRRLHLYALTSLFLLLTFNIIHAQDATTCETGFKLITHILGKTCVSEKPQRVVTLEWTYVEEVLALGVQPAGVADVAGYHQWVKIPVEPGADVADVGDRSEPNLEKIATLKPDLIIGLSSSLTGNYDQLNAIAPTIAFDPYPTDVTISQYDEMTTTFAIIATALNREDEGQAVLAHLDETYKKANAALEAAGHGGDSFILSQGWTYDSVASFRLFTDNGMAVQILKQIGLKNAWDAPPHPYGFTEIGIEGFADLKDKDFNFLYVAQEADNSFFAKSPIWGSLTFVKADHAYWLGGDVWLFGGPLSAEVLVQTVLIQMNIPFIEATPEATASS